jgi:predicted nuclease with TOPRIM domain
VADEYSLGYENGFAAGRMALAQDMTTLQLELAKAIKWIEELKNGLASISNDNQAIKVGITNAIAERDALQHELGRKDSDLLAANFRLYELQLDWQRMIQALDNLPGDMGRLVWAEYGRLKHEPEAAE